MKSFFHELFQRHDWLSTLPLIERSGDGWQGFALLVPPPPGSDLNNALDIEFVGNEVTIGLDYAHIHINWPNSLNRPGNSIWLDAMGVIEGILKEEIVALSGWIDGQLRVGSLRQVGTDENLIVPNLHLLRVRSWRGHYDRDEVLVASTK